MSIIVFEQNAVSSFIFERIPFSFEILFGDSDSDTVFFKFSSCSWDVRQLKGAQRPSQFITRYS